MLSEELRIETLYVRHGIMTRMYHLKKLAEALIVQQQSWEQPEVMRKPMLKVLNSA